MKVIAESDNSNLMRAFIKKDDEYYTLIDDIEKEVENYRDNLKDKVIYCNCDDVYKSNFILYFIEHFNEFKLKKLIATGISGYKLEVSKVTTNTLNDYRNKKLNKYVTEIKDGRYDSDICVELIKECDIVITNPPFSLFRDFVDFLFEHKKDFLIIGNQGACGYLNIFSYIYNKKLNIGYNHVSKFETKIDKSIIGASWYTTFKTKKPKMLLRKKYNKKEYSKYDNINAININRIADIPKDYKGVMGVPITFLKYYNSKQFQILGLAGRGKESKKYTLKKYKNNALNHTAVLKTSKGYKILFIRVLIKLK